MAVRKLRRVCCGFTLTELLVVLGVIAVLAAILFPVFIGALRKAKQKTCVSNLRQLGAALMLYAQDHDGVLLPDMGDVGYFWEEALAGYAKTPGVFRCPLCVTPARFRTEKAQGYAMNSELHNSRFRTGGVRAQHSIRYPATTVAFCEVSYTSGPQDTQFGRPIYQTEPQTKQSLPSGVSFVGGPGSERHGGGSNYGFADGHVKWHRPEAVQGADRGNQGEVLAFGL